MWRRVQNLGQFQRINSFVKFQLFLPYLNSYNYTSITEKLFEAYFDLLFFFILTSKKFHSFNLQSKKSIQSKIIKFIEKLFLVLILMFSFICCTAYVQCTCNKSLAVNATDNIILMHVVERRKLKRAEG